MRIVSKADLDFRTAVLEMEKGGELELEVVIHAVLSCLLEEEPTDPLCKVINAALNDVTIKYALTTGEKRKIVLEQAQSLNKYVIRYERHGNFEKKGDEA